MIQLQNYIVTCNKHILLNTMIYQMQKEKKMEHKYKPEKLFLEA